MRYKHAFFLLLAGILILPNLTWSQQRGGKGKMKAMQMAAADPDKAFDMLSGGKDVIIVSQLDPMKQQFLQGAAKSFNFTLGERVTRAEFKEKTNTAASMIKSGEITLPHKGKSEDGSAKGGGAARQTDRLEEYFFKLDKNSDGKLSTEEIPEDLRHERDTFDGNHDGFIDLNEFKAFVSSARPKTKGADRTASAGAEKQTEKAALDDAKPGIYRVGRLPKGLPEWFVRLDKDGDCDGQVGLWEARFDKKVQDDFNKMDQNGDGLLTAEEVLRYFAILKKKADANQEAAVAAAPPAVAPLQAFNPAMFQFQGGIVVPPPVAGAPAAPVPAAAPVPSPFGPPKFGDGNWPPRMGGDQKGGPGGGYRDRGNRGNGGGYGSKKPRTDVPSSK